MTFDLNDLYQETILDHNRSPRNFRLLPDANGSAEGYNPLCGDQVTVFLKWDGGRIGDLSFIGRGCAISKASASIMTTVVKGKSRIEAERLFEAFHRMVTGKAEKSSGTGQAPDSSHKLVVFSGVAAFPSRVKCATLPWHTLKAAMEGKGEPVSTESEGGNNGRDP